jgi:hypothetical protein
MEGKDLDLESCRQSLDGYLLTWMLFGTKNPKGSVRMQVSSYERAPGFALPMPPGQRGFTPFAAKPERNRERPATRISKHCLIFQ